MRAAQEVCDSRPYRDVPQADGQRSVSHHCVGWPLGLYGAQHRCCSGLFFPLFSTFFSPHSPCRCDVIFKRRDKTCHYCDILAVWWRSQPELKHARGLTKALVLTAAALVHFYSASSLSSARRLTRRMWCAGVQRGQRAEGGAETGRNSPQVGDYGQRGGSGRGPAAYLGAQSRSSSARRARLLHCKLTASLPKSCSFVWFQFQPRLTSRSLFRYTRKN